MRAFSICAILLSHLLAHAGEPAEKLAATGVAVFKQAYQAWDSAAFSQAADLFRQAITTGPASARFYYWLGVAEFHRMLQLQYPPDVDRAKAEAAREAALDALLSAIRLDSRHAESHALLATLYGMKIDGNLFRAARFGPRLQDHQKKALELGRENPRVLYLLGSAQFHIARKDSSLEAALATLLKAERRFQNEAGEEAGPLEPRWGHSSCLTFIARSYEKLNRNKEALIYYQKALAEHGNDHLAREGIERLTETN